MFIDNPFTSGQPFGPHVASAPSIRIGRPALFRNMKVNETASFFPMTQYPGLAVARTVAFVRCNEVM
jgi:hypothetical protein